jgi:hypothetical protein
MTTPCLRAVYDIVQLTERPPKTLGKIPWCHSACAAVSNSLWPSFEASGLTTRVTIPLFRCFVRRFYNSHGCSPSATHARLIQFPCSSNVVTYHCGWLTQGHQCTPMCKTRKYCATISMQLRQCWGWQCTPHAVSHTNSLCSQKCETTLISQLKQGWQCT